MGGSGKIGWLIWRVQHWDGSWVSWVSLAILLGMALAVGLLVYQWWQGRDIRRI